MFVKRENKMEEEKADKAIRIENAKRAFEEISYILHKYDFDIDEAIATLLALLTTGFTQMFENGASFDSIKDTIDGVTEKMYEQVLKNTIQIKVK